VFFTCQKDHDPIGKPFIDITDAIRYRHDSFFRLQITFQDLWVIKWSVEAFCMQQ
jgi:hypothetical protein